MKIAINKCYGGFSLSKKAYEYLGIEWDGYGFDYNDYDKRTDPTLIKCIEELGKKASGNGSDIKIIEIPDGIEYEIDDYDGIETVHEIHNSWG